jgi:hypothetical protein
MPVFVLGFMLGFGTVLIGDLQPTGRGFVELIEGQPASARNERVFTCDEFMTASRVRTQLREYSDLFDTDFTCGEHLGRGGEVVEHAGGANPSGCDRARRAACERGPRDRGVMTIDTEQTGTVNLINHCDLQRLNPTGQFLQRASQHFGR